MSYTYSITIITTSDSHSATMINIPFIIDVFGSKTSLLPRDVRSPKVLLKPSSPMETKEPIAPGHGGQYQNPSSSQAWSLDITSQA